MNFFFNGFFFNYVNLLVGIYRTNDKCFAEIGTRHYVSRIWYDLIKGFVLPCFRRLNLMFEAV
jgi:hypothetical protein